jgi:hypothetical protein
VTPRHRLPGLEPLDRDFGKDRSNPIDRWYIHEFLWERRTDVRGRVLEVANSGYTDYLGFPYGYALEDLDEEELSHRDDDYHFLIGVRARRAD